MKRPLAQDERQLWQVAQNQIYSTVRNAFHQLEAVAFQQSIFDRAAFGARAAIGFAPQRIQNLHWSIFKARFPPRNVRKRRVKALNYIKQLEARR